MQIYNFDPETNVRFLVNFINCICFNIEETINKYDDEYKEN